MPVRGCTLPLPNSTAIPLLPLWAVRPVQSLSACTRVHFTFTFTQEKVNRHCSPSDTTNKFAVVLPHQGPKVSRSLDNLSLPQISYDKYPNFLWLFDQIVGHGLAVTHKGQSTHGRSPLDQCPKYVKQSNYRPGEAQTVPVS